MNATEASETRFTPLDDELMTQLLAPQTAPCVSIYVPQDRATRDLDKNRIAFKNALKEATNELSKSYKGDAAADAVVADLARLDMDNTFWSNQFETLAVFAAPGRRTMLRLGRPLGQTVAVADSFHLKPLIRAQQSANRYHVLCLTQKSVRLLEGDGSRLEEVPLHSLVPKTLVEALGGELDEQHLTVASYGGLQGPSVHGQKDKADEKDIDIERYFRAIDKAIWEHHSRAAKLPLILAAVTGYHDAFHKVSKNTNLLDEGIKLNPDSVHVDDARLREEAQAIFEPKRQAKVDQALEDFGSALAQNQGSADLHDVAKAAINGRVQRLILSADKQVGGTLDPATGEVLLKDIDDPDVDDLLDDVAEQVLRTGGEVLVLPGEQHPQKSGIAAIYRY